MITGNVSLSAERIYIVIPLFNDWAALKLLLGRIQQFCPEELVSKLDFLIIDDCSTLPSDALPVGIGQSLSIMRLFRNVGHQKAIALGIAYLASLPQQHPVIVMDGDGEDRPEDLIKLVERGESTSNSIVFAHRSKRHESLLFRLFYLVYKAIFRLLTGKVITFGNFSYIPASHLRKLAHVSEIWNNYPGGVIRSRLPYTSIPLERGYRLAGKSKMNFVSLVLHGLSTISVLIDTTAVRLTIFCVAMIVVSLFGISIIVGLHFVSESLVPGWAGYPVFFFFIVILQAFLISLLLVFIVLSYRTQHQFIPAVNFQSYTDRVERIY
ncbi:glycosyltransferase [Spirosoma gilvum]